MLKRKINNILNHCILWQVEAQNPLLAFSLLTNDSSLQNTPTDLLVIQVIFSLFSTLEISLRNKKLKTFGQLNGKVNLKSY